MSKTQAYLILLIVVIYVVVLYLAQAIYFTYAEINIYENFNRDVVEKYDNFNNALVEQFFENERQKNSAFQGSSGATEADSIPIPIEKYSNKW